MLAFESTSGIKAQSNGADFCTSVFLGIVDAFISALSVGLTLNSGD